MWIIFGRDEQRQTNRYYLFVCRCSSRQTIDRKVAKTRVARTTFFKILIKNWWNLIKFLNFNQKAIFFQKRSIMKKCNFLLIYNRKLQSTVARKSVLTKFQHHFAADLGCEWAILRRLEVATFKTQNSTFVNSISYEYVEMQRNI